MSKKEMHLTGIEMKILIDTSTLEGIFEDDRFEHRKREIMSIIMRSRELFSIITDGEKEMPPRQGTFDELTSYRNC
jgi:3-phosphoglycerate kinase